MLVFLLRVCSKNETYFALSLVTIHFLVHFTLALTTKHDGICIPATTPRMKKPLPWSAPWLLPWPPLHPCHTTATLQHSNSAIIATTKILRMAGCCVFTFLLAHFCSLCCPCLHEFMLSPHPTCTLRGHNCLPRTKKTAKKEATVSFFI